MKAWSFENRIDDDSRVHEMMDAIGTPFELWFVKCVILALDWLAPDDYVWDMQNPGQWRDLFDSGMDYHDAVDLVFGVGATRQ